MSRGGVRDQLKEKDAKINSLIEELGNSQAMLNDKVAELAEVLPSLITSFHKLTVSALGFSAVVEEPCNLRACMRHTLL